TRRCPRPRGRGRTPARSAAVHRAEVFGAAAGQSGRAAAPAPRLPPAPYRPAPPSSRPPPPPPSLQLPETVGGKCVGPSSPSLSCHTGRGTSVTGARSACSVEPPRRRSRSSPFADVGWGGSQESACPGRLSRRL